MMKRALITGITGQDGSYLTELLIEKGYEVHGVARRCSTFNRGRIEHLLEIDRYTSDYQGNPLLHHGNLEDSSSMEDIIKKVNPDEIYNLGAQSQVRISFDVPVETSNINALGTLKILDSIKRICPETRFYQASSSEMFGKVQEIPQTEKTIFHPRSPYAISKVYAYYTTINYREAYNIHASNGILFNHESERRGESFVTRKITRSLTRIKLGLQHSLYLGNLDAERDWGYAKEYVEAMWLMLQQENPDDYVIGTGEKHSVREFLEESIGYLDLGLQSNGKKGTGEKYLDKDGKEIISIHERYIRPTEVDLLLADPSKAKRNLGWEPKVKFKDLARIMIDNDLELAKKELTLKR